ncbi:MAG TPA: creatininase family protein [Trueperaceae bacterium]|nr:creatininase family protein [Trueperaceae bacterium]
MRLLAELTRNELASVAPRALLVIPTAATEQHGPHLPLATDTFIGEAVARSAVAEVGDDIEVVLAPLLPYGSSHHHLVYGALSLSSSTYLAVAGDLLTSAIASGFRTIFYLNSHGGNDECLKLAARDTVLEHDVVIGACSYWDVARSVLEASAFPRSVPLPGHAGHFETCLMLAIAPELVELDRLPGSEHGKTVQEVVGLAGVAGVAVRAAADWRAIDGYTDSPTGPTAELGHELLLLIGRAVGHAMTELYRAAASL